MKKTTSMTGTVLVALIFLAVSVFAFSTYADVRDPSARDRGSGSTIEPTPTPSPVPSPAPTPIPIPTQPSGGITSSTSGSVNTGGNTGGNVTTGDESVEVFEVNIGPTNPPPPPPAPAPAPTPTPPAPAPECDGRTRDGCDTGRTR